MRHPACAAPLQFHYGALATGETDVPAITLSTDELALLRRCFATAKPVADGWEDQEDGDQIPISVEAAGSAATILAAAEADQPIEFDQAAWDAFAACCEVGADILDESRMDGLSDAQYEAVLSLVSPAFVSSI